MVRFVVRPIVRPAPALVEAYRGFRTPDIANALGGAVVADPGLRPAWPGARLLGTAFTAALPPGDNWGANASAHLAEPGDVLVIDGGGAHQAALVGGMIGRRALQRGVVGIVVDGAVRDCDDLRGLGLPVFGRAITARQATKTGPATLGGLARCGGVEVRPGSIVVADEDGVVFVPPALAADAVAKIQAVIDRERVLESDPAALEAAYAGLVARLERVDAPPLTDG